MEAIWVDLQHPYNAGKQFLLDRILMQLCYLLKQSLPGTAWVTFTAFLCSHILHHLDVLEMVPLAL